MMIHRIARRAKNWVRTIIPRSPVDWDRTREVTVGKFKIEIPVGNPLSYHYDALPHTQSCLIHLVQSIEEFQPVFQVVDIGANVGDTLALIKTGASVPVICIEGDPLPAQVLRRNAQRFEDVTVIQAYLGETVEQLNVEVEKEAWNSTLVPSKSPKSKALEITTADVLLLALPQWNQIRVVKVDCEGFDLRILRGAGTFLAKALPAILFELNYYNLAVLQEDGKAFFRWLVTLGYSRFFVFESHGSFLCEATLSSLSVLDDIDDFVRSGRNRLDYVDIVAFPEALSSAADAFRSKSKAHLAAQPRAGIDCPL